MMNVRFSMKSVNLNKSRSREIMQWVNIIFNGKGKTGHKWSRSSYEKSQRQRKNAMLGDFFFYTSHRDPFARLIYGVPLLPDDPFSNNHSNGGTFRYCGFVSSVLVKVNERDRTSICYFHYREKLACLRKLCLHMRFTLLLNNFECSLSDATYKIRFIIRVILSDTTGSAHFRILFFCPMLLSLTLSYLLSPQ